METKDLLEKAFIKLLLEKALNEKCKRGTAYTENQGEPYFIVFPPNEAINKLREPLLKEQAEHPERTAEINEKLEHIDMSYQFQLIGGLLDELITYLSENEAKIIETNKESFKKELLYMVIYDYDVPQLRK